MALEELLDIAMKAGVRRIVLDNLASAHQPDCWHWELLSSDPVKWYQLSTPIDFGFEWLGFGAGKQKPWGILPFRVERYTSITVGVHVGCERAGLQGVSTDSLEDGLRHAIAAYLCEFDIATCPHTGLCPHAASCDWEKDDWAL